MATTRRPDLRKCFILDLGLIDYRTAHNLQLQLIKARRDGTLKNDIVLLLEHPPVFTLGRRGGLNNLRTSEAFLRGQGIEIVHAERGGDITYHGPGQLVVYPIIDLREAGLGVADFVTTLEEVMIRTVDEWGISAQRNSLNRGVWVGKRKLGSIGIAVRRWISFHGLALNVNTILEHFSWINPCGLQGVSVTSMEQLLNRPIPMGEVRRSTLKHIKDIFGVELESLTLEDIHRRLAH
jgi:lipoate-protein ligase B